MVISVIAGCLIVYLIVGMFTAAAIFNVDKVKRDDIDSQGFVALLVIMWPIFLLSFLFFTGTWQITRACTFISTKIYRKN